MLGNHDTWTARISGCHVTAGLCPGATQCDMLKLNKTLFFKLLISVQVSLPTRTGYLDAKGTGEQKREERKQSSEGRLVKAWVLQHQRKREAVKKKEKQDRRKIKQVPTRLLCPWSFPGKDTGVGCHFLLLRIFPTQGSNSCLLHFVHCRRIIYHCTTILLKVFGPFLKNHLSLSSLPA